MKLSFETDLLKALVTGEDRKMRGLALYTVMIGFAAGAFLTSTVQHYGWASDSTGPALVGGAILAFFTSTVRLARR